MAVGRAYAGRSAAERRAERRGRLVAAAMELWGEGGATAVTVRGVCARAALTDRYFYESFPRREALLVAAYSAGEAELLGVLREVWREPPGQPYALIERTFAAFVGALRGDPRLARMAVPGPGEGAALERRRRVTITTVARLIEPFAAAAGPGTAYFCAGGIGALVLAWLDGGLALDDRVVAAECARLVAAAYGLPRGLPPSGGGPAGGHPDTMDT